MEYVKVFETLIIRNEIKHETPPLMNCMNPPRTYTLELAETETTPLADGADDGKDPLPNSTEFN